MKSSEWWDSSPVEGPNEGMSAAEVADSQTGSLFGPGVGSAEGMRLAARCLPMSSRTVNQSSIGEAVWGSRGDHLDIGTYWGGSAMLAALIKQESGSPGKVYTIDAYLRNGKPSTYIDNITTYLFRRWEEENVKDIIELAVGVSNPLPWTGPFETVYIDGGHDYEAVHSDWLNVKDITTKYVIFDDVGDRWPGVRDTFYEAAVDPEWRVVQLMHQCGVLERI